MFIEEQKASSAYDYREPFRSDPDVTERHVWSPISCRFTSWTYRSLCRTNDRGDIIKGSRQRCPFIIWG